ncbi:PrpF domain-containing protein [Zoogloea sp. LCSB751]|uniref:PrpF domain-containing protein n=1 Tax=Zoogloea sp. LCSB751 TaxID=1965277 RepID=UPI0034CE79F8
MGGATSSTSKVVVASRSPRADNDVDYLFGAVSVDRPVIDWSGNCGNLSAAVGPFAIHSGLVAVPPNGIATVRIWQVSIRRQILARFRWPTANRSVNAGWRAIPCRRGFPELHGSGRG